MGVIKNIWQKHYKTQKHHTATDAKRSQFPRLCRAGSQQGAQEKGRESSIHRVTDKPALPHFYSALVTTHIMLK